MLKAAAIDIGTNTLKMVVAEADSAGNLSVLSDERLGARLGEGVDATGKLGSDGQQRALEALRRLVNKARDMQVDRLRIVATSAVRDAVNRDEFVGLVYGELRERVEVLSEEDEALFSYKAIALDRELGDAAARQLVMDVGGGSTELAIGTDTRISSARSLRIGAVRLAERYLRSDPPGDDQLAEASVFAEGAIRAAMTETDVDRLVGVGGTVVNLAAMAYGIPVKHYGRVHGLRLTREQVKDSLSEIASLPLAERKKIVGLEADRADVIIGGVLIVDRVMGVFHAEDIRVSTRGLRYGVLYDLLDIGD